MVNDKMMVQMSSKDGFIAALDQSGGSTPGALRLYGIPDSDYSGDAEMFRLMHDMRVRIITAPAFSGAKVIAAILFERTLDAEAKGKPVPAYLWEERGVVDREGRQGARGGKGRRQRDEADAGSRDASRPGRETWRLWHQDALGDQSGVERRHRRHRETAVRVRRADRQARARPYLGAGSLDQEPGQGRCRGDPAGRTDQRARVLVGWSKGDVQADASRGSGLLRAANQRQPGRSRRRSL